MLTPDLRFHRVLAGAQEALDARVADHTVGPVAGRRVSNSPRPADLSIYDRGPGDFDGNPP